MNHWIDSPELLEAQVELPAGPGVRRRIGDLLRREARVAGRNTDLTRKEFEIVALLARQPGRVLTHRSILSSVWGPDYGTETHYLRVYASQIRKKLGNEPETPRLVAEPGVGYRLNEA